MKITIKGFVKAVTPVLSKTSGDKTYRTQNLIITVPGYRNEFQEQVGKDEDWGVEVFGDNIEKHKLLDQNLTGKKVEVNAYLNSRTYKKDGTDAYQLQLRIADYKILS
ncbi:MAG: hypothetical protein V4619_15500 [Bacteroidota bacterium]